MPLFSRNKRNPDYSIQKESNSHKLHVQSRGSLATFGSKGSKHVYNYISFCQVENRMILDHYFTKSELSKSSISGLMKLCSKL